MIFCGITLLPGERKNVPLPVPDAPSLNALCLCGAAPGKTLVVTAGVHGCEYVGIQALRRLAADLDPARLSGNVILLPLANPSAFYAGAKQVVPEDGVNLNRAFPGNSALHPLVFFPAAGKKMVNQVSLDAAKVLTVPYRVRSTAKNGLYSWAVQRDIPALLIERGGQGLWSEQEVDACCEDVRSLLRHLEIMPGGNPPRDQLEITETFYAEAESEGFWYPAVGLDQRVRRGELLGHLETLSGHRLQEVRAEFDGIVLYYTIALGVRAGDPLIAYGHP